MDWKEYEKFVQKYFVGRFKNANIQHNVFKPGFLSQVDRQVDLLIQQYICGYKIEIAIECKNWLSPLDVSDVEQFVSKLNDIKVTKGAMVTRTGYTKAAKQLANSTGNIQLHVLNIDELESFTGFWGNPYNGNSGAILFPPNGWILDSKVPKELIGATLCVMYPMELSIIESLQKKESILFYIPYVSKTAESSDSVAEKLQRIIKEQEEGALKFDKNVKFRYWEELTTKGSTKFRLIQYTEYNEVACFLCTNYCIMGIYGVCQRELADHFIDHLKFISSELIIVILENVDLDDSHNAWAKFLANHTNNGEIHKSIFR